MASYLRAGGRGEGVLQVGGQPAAQENAVQFHDIGKVRADATYHERLHLLPDHPIRTTVSELFPNLTTLSVIPKLECRWNPTRC